MKKILTGFIPFALVLSCASGPAVTQKSCSEMVGEAANKCYIQLGDSYRGTTSRYRKAITYYVKGGMEKNAAYARVTKYLLSANQAVGSDYHRYASYTNYLKIVQRINIFRIHWDLAVRSYARKGFSAYKKGQWPGASAKVYPEFVRINQQLAKLLKMYKENAAKAGKV